MYQWLLLQGLPPRRNFLLADQYVNSAILQIHPHLIIVSQDRQISSGGRFW
jgi:hypothetical protein